ncbi:hypothetical protein EW026_g3451 [Hermanssonia centrifuga]|uniref:Uncharacterized protein n=1 Tax=Hermanssonia centrifuga TaxID=98765 RepID=A0A4S4KPS0_9APHY|nr:hypothetical protein EW026_g3451 [Hermanssonia centrifuga]
MKPQPIHITGMINRRREAHRHRSEKSEILSEWRSDLRTEAKYDELLAQNASKDGVKLETEYASHLSDWDSLLIEKQNALNRTLNREIERQATPFPPEMLDQIAKARQFKFRNKAREFERECRGEVLPRTIARRNKRPPAHILARMTEKQKRWDKITRNVSEVGYVAYVKQKLGFKLRNPEAWKAELGKPEDQPRLDAMEEEIRRQNIAKRVQAQRALMRGERAKRKSNRGTQPKLDATA